MVLDTEGKTGGERKAHKDRPTRSNIQLGDAMSMWVTAAQMTGRKKTMDERELTSRRLAALSMNELGIIDRSPPESEESMDIDFHFSLIWVEKLVSARSSTATLRSWIVCLHRQTPVALLRRRGTLKWWGRWQRFSALDCETERLLPSQTTTAWHSGATTGLGCGVVMCHHLRQTLPRCHSAQQMAANLLRWALDAERPRSLVCSSAFANCVVPPHLRR
jgi:hypothetical protein